jgi:hypothetical protein
MEGIHRPKSLGGRVHVIEEHGHAVARMYPELADGVTVTGAAGAWTLGAAAEIVAANGITEDFDIHYVYVSGISGNDQYQLNLYDDGVLVAEVGFTKSATADPVRQINCMTPMIQQNSAITAKLASSAGGSDTCVVKIGYHTY